MRRSISWRASTALEAFSSGSPRVCTDLSSSRRTSAENLARLMSSLGLALRHTSITCASACALGSLNEVPMPCACAHLSWSDKSGAQGLCTYHSAEVL